MYLNSPGVSVTSCSINGAAMELGLALMLRAAWLAGTLPIVLASIPYSRLSFLHNRLLGFSSRGKTREHSSHKYTVPQKFFLHFYMVAALWTTLLLLSTWFYAYRTDGSLVSESFHYSTVASHLMGGSHVFSIHKSHLAPVERRFLVWRTVVLLLLMEAQVLRRLYETLYVFSYSPLARMHIFGYLTGMFFYIAAPVSLCSSCAYEGLSYTTQQVALFIVKAQAQKEVIEFDWRGYVKPFLKLHLIQWMGVAIFIWGWIHQYRCHAILGSLREHNDQAIEYAIPRGDWFEIVSCPHYLAEIVIFAGLLVASGGSDITVWFLLVFVVSNLVFAAAETQRWYLRKFDKYPRSRRAILPFVY